MQQKVIITIAGNMGAGKTALAGLLAQDLGWHGFFEQPEENPYLADFYGDMPRWGFHSQLFFLAKRLQLYRELLAHPAAVIVQDRGIYEDAEVFARNLYAAGHMTSRDYALYRSLYEECMTLMPLPGFVVYLKTSVSALQERIKRRGRPYEREVPPEYLAELNELYDSWIANFSHCPVITVPTDSLNIVDSRADFEHVRDRILDALNAWKQGTLEFDHS